MSYKIFYNSGNDNAYFDACRQTAGAKLDEVYNCCRTTCGSHPTCSALCSQVYPGTIVEDCAFYNQCWLNGFDKQCVQTHKNKIKDCCRNVCKGYQNSQIINNNILPSRNIPDCDTFCDVYELV